MKQTIDKIDVDGKRVLMRVDFNVPVKNGIINDDRRIRMALPSILSVLERGGSLTLLSHLGRPTGKGVEPEFSLAPVALRLSELLGVPVSCSNDDTTSTIILRENLRFNAGEKLGSSDFASTVVTGSDIYCNDAFGTAHREHASMVAVPEAMQGKPRVAGLLLAKELQYLDNAIAHAEQPFVAVLGGAKVADKMGAIENLLGKVDTILIGGAMAYTFLVSLGEDVGSSLVEKNRVLDAKKMLEQAKKSTTTIMLPTDHVCAKQIGGRVETTTMHTPIPQGLMGLDIGPETIKTYSGILKKAKTIVWNGPMGVFEVSPYDEGTKRMATAVSEATEQGAVSIVGGGDTASAVSLFELESKMTHLSTGGGASLQMLEGKAFSSVALLDDAL